MKLLIIILAICTCRVSADGIRFLDGSTNQRRPLITNQRNPLKAPNVRVSQRMFDEDLEDTRIHFIEEDSPVVYAPAFYPVTSTLKPLNRAIQRIEKTKILAAIPVQPVDYETFNVSYAVTNFGLNLIQVLRPSPAANVVISPSSIATLLALLQQAAIGETQSQISRALHMTPENAATSYRDITANILERARHDNIYNVATNLFVSQHFDLNPVFRRIATDNFGSEVTQIYYENISNAIRTINGWVANKTQNMIDKIVSPDSIGRDTQLVLANAMYFKGVWAAKFMTSATRPGPFRLRSGSTTTVNYMRIRQYYRTAFDPMIDAEVAVIPFKGGDYSLIVILPSEVNTLEDVLSALTNNKLAEYQRLDLHDINLILPKFTVKTDVDLNTPLKKLGIVNMFNQYSDLSRLGVSKGISPQVSTAQHSAMLSIDEEGGKASASTIFAAVPLSFSEPSKEFIVDRPFLAILWDTKLALPLIIAKIESPSS